jgi:hypothetical protein
MPSSLAEKDSYASSDYVKSKRVFTQSVVALVKAA